MEIQQIKSIIKSINAIKEPVFREHAMVDKITGLNVSDFIDLFYWLIQNINLENVKPFYFSIIRVLLDEKFILQEKREEIFNEFTARNLSAIGKMVIKLKPMFKHDEFSDNIYEFEEIPLGIRKSKARQHNRDLLMKLIPDPNPDVISLLIDNPLLKEDDIVRIVARRPQNPAIFPVVFFHKKWLLRQSVQRSIVKNPFCPPHFSISIIPLLERQDLSEIKSDETLHEAVRETAKFVMNLR